MLPLTNGKTVSVSSDRELGYGIWGDPNGYPLLYFHGVPGSRLSASLGSEQAKKLGVCLISLDRPGIGLSSPLKGRTFTDWPADVANFAQSAGLEEFSILGLSGGSPYALACAELLPLQVNHVAIVSGIGPPSATQTPVGMNMVNRIFLTLARRSPTLLRVHLRLLNSMRQRTPVLIRRMIRSGFAAEDQLILDRSMVWETLQTDIAEAFRQGIGGLAHEITLYTLAWGIDLRRIQVPVELWHGEQDKNIPASTVEQLSQSLTCSSVKILPGCGHLLIVDNMSRIVQTLLP